MDQYKKKEIKFNARVREIYKKNKAIQFVKGMRLDGHPMKITVTSIMRRSPRGRWNDSVNK